MQEIIRAVSQLYHSDQDTLNAGDFKITRASQGMNGIIYRVTSNRDVELAVKLSIQDERDRGGREYAATTALHHAGFTITPEPLYLDYHIPELPGMTVFISTWLAGKRLDAPPAAQDKRSWRDILYALATAHNLTPQDTSVSIQNAIMPIFDPIDLLTLLEPRRERLPQGQIGALTSDQIDYVLYTLGQSIPQQWENSTPVGLILCDPNPNNMISHRGNVQLVDWEYSGWADPAYEIGDLCAQPMYFDLPDEHRVWIRSEHGRILNDATLPMRAEIYERIMNVFWVLNMSAHLIGRSNQRLAGVHKPSPEYFAKMQLRYWERACSMLEITF